MNNIFYHSSYFMLPIPLPGSQSSFLQHPGFLFESKAQGKTSLFSCAIPANADLTSTPPKYRLTAEVQIFLDFYCLFLIHHCSNPHE